MDEADEKIINQVLQEEHMEPKVQWSKFSPDRSEQFVIRVDTWEELVILKNKVEGVLPQSNAFPDDTGHLATPQDKVQEETPVHHGKPMTKGKWGWYCKTKLEDGTWCKFKPE